MVAEGKETSPLAVTQGLAGASPVSHPKIGVYSYQMLKCLVVLAIFLLGGCATAPGNNIELKITNTAPFPLVIHTGVSIFSVSVILMPGQTWTGTVDRRWVATSATISIEQYLPGLR